MRELVTTALDAVGLLLLAAGATAAAWRMIGASALAVGGVVVLVGSFVASWLDARGTRQPITDEGDL